MRRRPLVHTATPITVHYGSVYVEPDGWRLAYHQQSEVSAKRAATAVIEFMTAREVAMFASAL
jgi:hypothetical protein